MKITRRNLGISSLFVLLVIILVSYLSLKNTLDFYFYSDDYAVLYHHINDLKYYPPFYTFVPKFYGWIYDIFGLNPKPFFLFGIITHVFASMSVYLFVEKFTKNKIIAFFSSLIFATGYIGIESFSQMNTASVDNLNVFLTMLLLISNIYYLETRSKIYYFISLGIFSLGLVLFPFRAFQMLFFLILMDLVISLSTKKLKTTKSWVRFFIMRNLVFVFLYFISGVALYGGGMLGKFIKSFSFENFSLFFSVIGNMVLPKSINSDAPKDLVGICFTIIIISFVVFFRKNILLSKSLLLSLIFLIGGFLGFFILLPSFDANAELNRYLSLSFVGFSMIPPILLSLLCLRLSKERLVMVLCVFLVSYTIILMNLSFNHQENFVRDRSVHAEKLFSDLKQFVPRVDPYKMSVFYFDVFQESTMIVRFDSSIQVAFMDPRASFSVHYKVPFEKISIILNKKDLEKKLKNSANYNIYTFYYDKDGLRKTLYNYEK